DFCRLTAGAAGTAVSDRTLGSGNSTVRTGYAAAGEVTTSNKLGVNYTSCPAAHFPQNPSIARRNSTVAQLIVRTKVISSPTLMVGPAAIQAQRDMALSSRTRLAAPSPNSASFWAARPTITPNIRACWLSSTTPSGTVSRP